MFSIKKKYRGVVIPMITPFTDSGSVDELAVIRIIKRFVDVGVYPFILGTTGEAASVSQTEKERYVEIVCREFKNKTTIYAGIASNSIEESINAANKYFELGVDAVVANLPSYYVLNEDQMYKYFVKLADMINGPLIVYNITATTHMSIPLEIVDKLSKHPNIIGLKDSERDEERLKDAISRFKDRDDFVHQIGWAAQSVNGLSLGSDGLVPSTGNFIPGMFQDLFESIQNNDYEKAQLLQEETDTISKIYQTGKGLGHSLAALKVIMNEIGLCETNMLPALTKLDEDEENVIRKKVNEIRSKI